MTEPFFPVESAPSYGDIVWGHFPETIGKPGPKPRPVLILATCINKGYKHPYATVQCAYGTSNLKLGKHYTRFHLIIQNTTALNKFRLPQATRFDLDKANVTWLPWSETYFRPRTGQATPALSRLDEEYMLKLETIKAVRTVIEAEDDD